MCVCGKKVLYECVCVGVWGKCKSSGPGVAGVYMMGGGGAAEKGLNSFFIKGKMFLQFSASCSQRSKAKVRRNSIIQIRS